MECLSVLVVLLLVALGAAVWTLFTKIGDLQRRLDLQDREIRWLREAATLWRRQAASVATEVQEPVESPVPPAAPVPPPPVFPAPEPLPAPIPEPAPAVEARPPIPSAPPRVQPAYAAAARRKPFDWESLVGVQLFSWIAGILLALAAIQFLRYSIEHGWLSPAIRAAFGFATGIGLLLVCELRVARRYAVTANAMDAAGIAILFATTFASYSLWQLLGAVAAFGLMAVITAVAVWLSLRRDSLFIALLGMIGGFATPALLSTGQDRPLSLFGYLLLLNAGLAWVALRRNWPLLSIVSLAFTTLYQWGWVVRFLDAPELPLAVGIFLAFPALAVAAPLLTRDPKTGEAPGGAFGWTAAVGTALPLLFAVYLAAVPGYGDHYGLLFGFLLVLDAGLALIAAKRGPELLHALAGGITLLVTGVWFSTSYRPEAWPEILAIVAALVLFYLAAPWILARLGSPLGPTGRLGTFTAPFLLFSCVVLLAKEPSTGSTAVVLLALLAATAAFGLLERDGRPSLLAFGIAGVALIAWVARLGAKAWLPEMALGFAAAFSILAGLALAAARRRETEPGPLSSTFAWTVLVSLFLGQVLLIVAGSGQSSIPLSLLIPAHALFLGALLALAAAWGWSWPGPVSVGLTAVAVVGWLAALGNSAPPRGELLLAGSIYLVYLAYPLVLSAVREERARRLREPYLTAVFASLPFFFFGWHALDRAELDGLLGLLPLAQAAALGVILLRLLRLEPAGERDLGRLALISGAALAFVTVAVPLQFEREWITLGWALLAAALAWLYVRIPHRQLLFWTAGLLAASFARLALNPAVLTYHPRSGVPLWNSYLYIYLVPAVAFFVAAWYLKRTDDRLLPELPRLSGLANGGATALLFLLLNVQIADFFSQGEALTFGFLTGEASLAEDLSYTLGWALFAIGLLVAGLALGRRPARIAAILLLLLAVLKGFLHDLAQLGGLYRVGSFVGLAAALALVAVLIQKFVLARREEG